ncbi:MAG: hypothetical protein RBT45_06835 [Acholeplasmataceae bacterium]|jgi:hypothetical protein|nr:hypothetical protein [Acholeplasmataceae bacterium]
MSFLLSLFQILAFTQTYVEWINTHVIIPLKENLYDYTELPEAFLYIDGILVDDPEIAYQRDGVERTFISTVSTSYVKTYTIYYRVIFPSYDISHVKAISFEIKDMEPPKIIDIPSFRITLLQELPSLTQGLRYADNYDEFSNIIVIVDQTHIIKNRVGIYPIYYQIIDSSGNTKHVSTTIEIYDHLSPDITLKKEIILNFGDIFIYTD